MSSGRRVSQVQIRRGQALAEFRNYSTDAGSVGSCWSTPLTKSGAADAETMSGPTRQAKEARVEFRQ